MCVRSIHLSPILCSASERERELKSTTTHFLNATACAFLKPFLKPLVDNLADVEFAFKSYCLYTHTFNPIRSPALWQPRALWSIHSAVLIMAANPTSDHRSDHSVRCIKPIHSLLKSTEFWYAWNFIETHNLKDRPLGECSVKKKWKFGLFLVKALLMRIIRGATREFD